MDNLEEDLTCSVCYSLFSDPRVLPCSHTFCKTCLESVLQVSTNFWRPLRLPLKCPNCRNVVELPPLGVDALPINVSLRAIIEKYQKDYQPQPPSCPDHPRQPLNVYCVQDRQLICGLCLTIGQHHGHPIDDLQAAFVREKETPACLLARLSDERWTHVCELGEQLEQEKARCEGLVRKDRLAVDQFFHRLEVALAKKRDAYLGVLDDASTEISQVYTPLINRIKEIQEEQLELVNFGSSVEEEESPLVFLEKVHLFRERVEAIVKAPLPSVISLSITPRAAEYLQQQWPAVTIGGLDEGPIPRVCCCAKPSPRKAVQELEVRDGLPETWPQDLWVQLQPTPAMVLLGLLLLMVALWVNPIGGASLAFSLLSQFGQLVRGLSTDLTTAICEITGLLYTEMGDAVKRWSSVFFTLGSNAYQQLTLLYNSLSLT